MIKSIVTLILCLFVYFTLWSACEVPYSVRLTEQKTNSAIVSWKDNNASVLGFQIAYVEKGKTLSEATRSIVIQSKTYSFTNLRSGTQYQYWLRTVCAVGDTSNWQGSFNFTTVIDNNNSCGLNLILSDNNCANSIQDVFEIAVDLGSNGSKYKLESVSLIINHTWPADLHIMLESPSGNRTILSNHNGSSDDNMGLFDTTCLLSTTFSDIACQKISSGKSPFLGTFIPDEPLSQLQETNVNGKWKLLICDDAINDRGVLKYAVINFAENKCKSIDQFLVQNVTAQSFDINWIKPDDCITMQIFYKEVGETNYIKKFINCNVGHITIDSLNSESEYEFFLVSECNNSFSNLGCNTLVKTICTNYLIQENFDLLASCEPSCTENCDLNSTSFRNINSDGMDWIINEGDTPSDITGPSSGVFQKGKYAYIESNPNLCGNKASAILETQCLKGVGIPNDCGLNFYYHMFGQQIGELKAEITKNNVDWFSIFDVKGAKGDQWNEAILQLPVSNDELFKLRFVGTTLNGTQGDIAIDQISITSATLVNDHIFYFDEDGDGYGTSDSTIVSCSSNPPLKYVSIQGDCNDRNPNVNPSKSDIACNLIDENCDGVLQLINTTNPITLISLTTKDESCQGKKDGSINTVIDGGSPPYSFKWSNQEILQNIINLNAGFYSCIITDRNGCGLSIDSIEIKTLSTFNVAVDQIDQPSCLGKEDGSIFISHTSKFIPVSYIWSNNFATKNLINVEEGNYKVTVKDALGCTAVSDNISLLSIEKVKGVSTFKKAPLCFGDETGIMEVQGINGKSPYNYFWENGSISNRREQLKGGIYIITITDSEGCKVFYKDEIIQPKLLTSKVLNTEDVRCFGSKTGSIKLNIKGGTPPYHYDWQDIGNGNAIRNNLSDGNYAVTISDNNGCTTNLKDIVINNSLPISYNIDSLIQSSCLQKNDGKIIVSVIGGQPPYEYFWNGVKYDSISRDSLYPGTYILSILDVNRCKLTTDPIEVNSGNINYNATLTLLQSNKCPSDSIASIEVKIDTNSTLPIDYNWSNGKQVIANSFSNINHKLPSGIYNVTITDQNGCISKSESISVPLITPFTYSLNVNQNQCKDDSTAAIEIFVNGGKKPYRFLWNNLDTSNKISNLIDNIYQVTITDDHQCELTPQPIILSSVSNLSVSTVIENETNNNKDGKIRVYADGGKNGYQIHWQDPNLSGFFVENLSANKYCFTIADGLNCNIDTCVIVDKIVEAIPVNLNKIKVHPNPFSDHISIESDELILDVKLFDISGKEITIDKLNYNSYGKKIFTSHLPLGLFFLNILTSKQQYCILATKNN